MWQVKDSIITHWLVVILQDVLRKHRTAFQPNDHLLKAQINFHKFVEKNFNQPSKIFCSTPLPFLPVLFNTLYCWATVKAKELFTAITEHLI